MSKKSLVINLADIMEIRRIVEKWESEGLILQDNNAIKRICNVQLRGEVDADSILSAVIRAVE